MAELSVTVIDVGWGDSILVESVDEASVRRFGLIDCNDYEYLRSGLIFVKRRLERLGIDYDDEKPNFEWVLLTHGHADHARGLKRMMSTFGTRHFWYPKSVESTTYGSLLHYANLSTLVQHHQAIDRTKVLDHPAVSFGDVQLHVLWPDHDTVDTTNENNNSVVLALTLGTVTFVLTGDAEADNWPAIIPRLPPTVKVFQVPHHGGRNGVFDTAGATPWVDHLSPAALLALSSHIRPHGHPHPDVVDELTTRGFEAYHRPALPPDLHHRRYGRHGPLLPRVARSGRAADIMAIMDRRRLSKAMAYHLRHGREVPLLPGGWAQTDNVVGVLRPRPTRDAVLAVVAEGDKPRFEVSDDRALIRARYGHSRDVDLGYVPARPPAVLYHGTGEATVPVLCAEGIHRRGRRFVHLSDRVAAAVEVGARHGPPAVVRVAAGRMHDDGHRFFHAAAGMWLTDGVPRRYLVCA